MCERNCTTQSICRLHVWFFVLLYRFICRKCQRTTTNVSFDNWETIEQIYAKSIKRRTVMRWKRKLKPNESITNPASFCLEVLFLWTEKFLSNSHIHHNKRQYMYINIKPSYRKHIQNLQIHSVSFINFALCHPFSTLYYAYVNMAKWEEEKSSAKKKTKQMEKSTSMEAYRYIHLSASNIHIFIHLWCTCICV